MRPRPSAGATIHRMVSRYDRPQTISEGRGAAWILALSSLFWPRLFVVLFWIFSDMLGDAFDSWVVPFLGFFLLPWTTLAYAAFWDWGTGHQVTGIEWFFVALAFLIDVSSWAGGRRARYGN